MLLIKILTTAAEERITLKEYLQERFPIKSYERRCNSTQGVSYPKEESLQPKFKIDFAQINTTEERWRSEEAIVVIEDRGGDRRSRVEARKGGGGWRRRPASARGGS